MPAMAVAATGARRVGPTIAMEDIIRTARTMGIIVGITLRTITTLGMGTGIRRTIIITITTTTGGSLNERPPSLPSRTRLLRWILLAILVGE